MTRVRTVAFLALPLVLFLVAPAVARAAEQTGDASSTENLVGILLAVVVGLLASVGLGATILLLRIMLPGVARAADDSIGRLGTKRLLLGGLLPMLGAALLAQGVGASGSDALGGIYLLVVGLPIFLALLVGAMAALPRVGAGALRGGERASPFARCAVGGVVIGLAMISWALPPLGAFVSLLLSSWLLGAGLGAFVRRPPALQSDPVPYDAVPSDGGPPDAAPSEVETQPAP